MPEAFGQRREAMDKALMIDGRLRTSWKEYDTYELYQIRGPFPTDDTTKSIEALYISVFTLGLAEIVMLPPTAIIHLCQNWQKRPFVFLYNSSEIVVGVASASTGILDAVDGEVKYRDTSLNIEGK